MTNNEQQTAVEWLIGQLHRKYGGTDFFWTNMDEIEQAKEMEKQQIIDAYHTNPLEAKWKNIGVNYYNETYGGGEQ
jgi:disulfide oxidoreductase YuzD